MTCDILLTVYMYRPKRIPSNLRKLSTVYCCTELLSSFWIKYAMVWVNKTNNLPDLTLVLSVARTLKICQVTLVPRSGFAIIFEIFWMQHVTLFCFFFFGVGGLEFDLSVHLSMKPLLTTSTETCYITRYNSSASKNQEHVPSVVSNAHAKSMRHVYPMCIQTVWNKLALATQNVWKSSEITLMNSAAFLLQWRLLPSYLESSIREATLWNLPDYQKNHHFQCIFNICLLF